MSGGEGGQAEFVEVLNDLTEMQQSRDSQRQMESQLARTDHAGNSMKALLSLPVAPQVTAELVQSVIEQLPAAFRAPSLLRVHLQSPWLTTGRRSSGAENHWQKNLDFGGGRSGCLEIYYVDPTGSLGGSLDSEERALVEAFALALQSVGRRTAS